MTDDEFVIMIEEHEGYPAGTMLQVRDGKAYSPMGIEIPIEKTTAANGQLLSREQYPALYAVVGSTYGAEGAEFRVPDLRGRRLM